MSNTLRHLFHAFIVHVFMGGVFLAFDGNTHLMASMTGHGTTVASAVHSASPVAEAPLAVHLTSGTEIVLGILLIFLGFGAHAVLRKKDSRAVRVRAVPRKKNMKKKAAWFWMELRV